MYCRYSGRLTWVLIDWIIRNTDKINIDRLLQITAKSGNITVLGLISDLAKQKQGNAKLEFFHRVSQSKLATRLTIEQNLPIYDKWNFYCNELRYLTTDNKLKDKR